MTGRRILASCARAAAFIAGRLRPRPSKNERTKANGQGTLADRWACARAPGLEDRGRPELPRVSCQDVPTREELSGNTEGLKANHHKRLLATYRRRVRASELCSAELARHLTELSRELGRQLGVLINRRGEIEHVIVGDARQIFLPDIGRARAGQLRLRGLRLVHTHLKDEPLDRDDLTDLVLLRLDGVAAISARPDGLPG